MDTLSTTLRDFLMEYASFYSAEDTTDFRTEVITDTEGGHFLLVQLGWDEDRYIYQCLMHLDVRDGKVWIQRNKTEVYVAEELVARGLSPEQIVLGLQPPALRCHTGYAAA